MNIKISSTQQDKIHRIQNPPSSATPLPIFRSELPSSHLDDSSNLLAGLPHHSLLLAAVRIDQVMLQ